MFVNITIGALIYMVYIYIYGIHHCIYIYIYIYIHKQYTLLVAGKKQ